MLTVHSFIIFVITGIEGFIITEKGLKKDDLEGVLFLTPLLEEGRYKEAQMLSKVQPEIGNLTSYSGFLTVDKKCDSHLFFWFFPALKEDWEDRPLILWLQGGPGASSLYGLFEELGPFESYKEGLKRRQYPWNIENNLLFIDQPVGTGYSFTWKDCYRTREIEIGEDLYQAVVQFHLLFPSFQKVKFFIAGESYAGHFIPALGHTIHKHNPSAELKINLSAMMIGNGYSDPAKQIDFASYFYQLGFIDYRQKLNYEILQQRFEKEVEAEEWIKAVKTRTKLETKVYDSSVGKRVNMYNYIRKIPKPKPNWQELIQLPEVRKAIHVGNLSCNFQNYLVYDFLLDDTVKSVTPIVEELLEIYPIIFYYGQLDIICAYPMAINFLRSLSWSGEKQYLNATRSKWCVGDEQAGYFKGERNLYDVLVRGAGHMVPADQPHWAYILVNSVTSGTPDNPLHALKTCD